MIYTFYSNHYEWLQEALFKSIAQELDELRGKLSQGNYEDIFKQIPVICLSPVVEDQLSRALVDRDRNKSFTNPGVEFKSIYEWIDPFLDTPLQQDSQDSDLVWKIWYTLKKDYNHKAEDNAQNKRLCDYVFNSDDDQQLLDFCVRLSTLYTTYASQRPDWLDYWAGKRQLDNPEDAKNFEKHSDYYWQKELWKKIAARTNNNNTNNPKNDKESKLQDFIKEVKGKTFHLFMPFSLSLQVWDLFKKTFADSKEANLRLYILNQVKPSKQQEDNAANQYLTRNTATTEALLKHRLHIEGVKDLPEGPNYKSGDELKTQDPASCQGHYLPNKDDTYLHKFQNSVLLCNPELLPGKPNEDDESLKVFKAPSFIRELEGIVDWIHYRLRKDETLRLSDILITVPDIKTAAAEIENVMDSLSSLSKDLSIDYRIIGRPEIDSELTVQAIIELGKLLNSPFYKDDFFEWLELPINQKKWNLSLSDVTTLNDWLNAAGFYKGLSNEHLEFIKREDEKPEKVKASKEENTGLKKDEQPTEEEIEDYSLDSAIERLVIGYLAHSSDCRAYKDIAPMFEANFKKVSSDGGRLLKTLISISELMKSAWLELIKPSCIEARGKDKEEALDQKEEIPKQKEPGTPEEWRAVVNNWINEFIDSPEDPRELISFRSTFKKTIESMESTLPENTKVPFDALWALLESKLKSSSGHVDQRGGITFAPISAVRGLSFRVIVAAGFNEESGFPGRPTPDEFDLLGEEKLLRLEDYDSPEGRPKDYDPSDDKKAQFLDVLLAARDALVLSYSSGTDIAQQINPSTVMENFKDYFLSHAKHLDSTNKTAKDIWKTIEVPIPLHSFSKGNFDPKIKKWTSPRRKTLESIELAEIAEKDRFRLLETSTQPQDRTSIWEEKIFIDKKIPVEPIETLPAKELEDFFCNPDGYTLKRFSLPGQWKNSDEDEKDSKWLGDMSALTKSTRAKGIFNELKPQLLSNNQNVPCPEASNAWPRGKYDPSYGIQSVREEVSEEEIGIIYKNLTTCRKELGNEPPQSEIIQLKLLEETQALTNIEHIVDFSSDFYIVDRVPKLVVVANSNSAETKAKIKYLIWHAACQRQKKDLEELECILIPPPNENLTKLDFLKGLDVTKLVNTMVKIFSVAREQGISLADIDERQEKPNKILWRGVNEEIIKAIDTKYKKFKKLLDTLLTAPKKSKGAIPKEQTLEELTVVAEKLYKTLEEKLQGIHND